ncbi:MAG: hypothetical protein ACREVP_12585 [Burkholderiales bacterium]
MSKIYHEGQRTLQDRFDTRRPADRIGLGRQTSPSARIVHAGDRRRRT